MTSSASVRGSIGKPSVSWLHGGHPIWLVVAIALPSLILIGSVALPNEEVGSVGLALVNLAILSALALGWAVRAALAHRHSMPRLSATLWAALVGIAFWIISATLDDLRAHDLLHVDILVPLSVAFRVLGVGALILAAYLAPRTSGPRPRYWRATLDLAIAMMAALYIVWAGLWGPTLARASAAGPVDWAVVSWQLGQTAVPLVLMWAGLRLLFGVYGRELRPAATLLAVCYMLITMHAVMASELAVAAFTIPHWVDHVLRGAALALAMLAATRASMARPYPVAYVEGFDGSSSTRWPWRSLFALGTLWVVYTFFAIGAEGYATDAIPGNYEVAAVFFGLLFVLSGIQQVLDGFNRVRLARQLQAELTQREAAEAKLQSLNADLEERVSTRTSELAQANEQLRQEVDDRRRAESALRESEARLLHDAFHDSLTGLPNRALLLDRIGRALERTRRHIDYRFAVLFLDFDGFRVINDSLGHSLGDTVLIENARRLQMALRGIDTLARLGGDEFVALIDDVVDEDAAVAVADRLQTALALPVDGQGQRLYTTASIGIVLSSAIYETAQDLLRDAEVTMYHAKALGRSRHAVFNAGMRARAIARLVLENELRLALERGELTLHYQPILDLRTDQITGFEALVRWRHPYRGLVPPSEFIPIAEETGSIVPIGHWVLREASAQLARWRQATDEAKHLTMSVNLSTRQFREKDLASQVGLALMQAGLEPEALKVEITETALVEDADQALVTLDALRALGVQVQIDDFGTGYSSLSYLQRFPVDTLKIDRSFIGRISAGDDSLEIVRSIVNLAHGLGLTVIAEGVETQEQLNFIKALACELGQGYLISKPLEAERAFEYIVRPVMALLTVQ